MHSLCLFTFAASIQCSFMHTTISLYVTDAYFDMLACYCHIVLSRCVPIICYHVRSCSYCVDMRCVYMHFHVIYHNDHATPYRWLRGPSVCEPQPGNRYCFARAIRVCMLACGRSGEPCFVCIPFQLRLPLLIAAPGVAVSRRYCIRIRPLESDLGLDLWTYTVMF